MSQDNTQTSDAQQTEQKNPQDDGQVNPEDFAAQSAPKNMQSGSAGEQAESGASGGSKQSDNTSFVTNITSKRGLLSALSATLLVLVVPVLVYLAGTGTIALTSITGLWAWLFVSVFGMAAVRLFGKDALTAIQQARGKK